MEKKEIGFNTRCENFKQKLIDVVNHSNLPIGVVFYITQTIMSEIESTYYGTLNSEAQEVMETSDNGGNE